MYAILFEKGYYVIGLDIKDVNKYQNLLFYKVDITNIEQIKVIKKRLEQDNIILDSIINIAGIHKMASLVEEDFSNIEKLININLIGTMAINNHFHSLLSKNGRIIIVTSEVASFDPMPFNGLYSVSKTALECYAQALRQELNLIGQKVITILPGAINTALSQNSLIYTKELSDKTILYKKQSKKFLKITKKFMGKPLPAYKLSKLIFKATTTKRPKLSYKIHHNLGLVLLNLLPKRLQCFIIKQILN